MAHKPGCRLRDPMMPWQAINLAEEHWDENDRINPHILALIIPDPVVFQ